MTDPIQRSPRVRRGGWLALITVIALLVLASGAYAIGRNIPDNASTTTAQRTTDVPAAAMTTWAQHHSDELAWMRTHHTEWNWMRTHRADIAWMRTHHADWHWMRTHRADVAWMRTHPHAWTSMRARSDAWQSPTRARHDAGSSVRRSQRQHDRMHDGGGSRMH